MGPDVLSNKVLFLVLFKEQEVLKLGVGITRCVPQLVLCGGLPTPRGHRG